MVRLTIPQTLMEDAGTYTLRLTNEHGVSEQSVEVTVTCIPPRLTKPLHDVTVPLNHTVTFECQVRPILFSLVFCAVRPRTLVGRFPKKQVRFVSVKAEHPIT